MLKEVKKMSLTAKAELDDVVPMGDNVTVVIKSWPSQSESGILAPDSYTVIRGEKYVTQVVSIGEDVKYLKEGDVAIMSMYSGHHIATKTGHGKIVPESEIMAFKEGENMILSPEKYTPGINYILVKITKEKELITESGLVVPTFSLNNDSSKQDVSTIVGEVVSFGPVNKYGKEYKQVKVGSTIIFDSYVGLDLPNMDVSGDTVYRMMYASDILGIIKE